MDRIRRLVITLALAALALPAMISTAVAAPPYKEQFRDQFSFSTELCEVPVEFAGEVRGMVLGKERGPTGFFYFGERIHLAVSWTNPENGRTISQKSNYINKDQKITDNGDGSITITVLATGGETTFGPDGKLLFNNPGQIRYQIHIDESGVDTDLGVVFGSTGRNDEFDCTLVASLLTG